jgi:hypothetical protein
MLNFYAATPQLMRLRLRGPFFGDEFGRSGSLNVGNALKPLSNRSLLLCSKLEELILEYLSPPYRDLLSVSLSRSRLSIGINDFDAKPKEQGPSWPLAVLLVTLTGCRRIPNLIKAEYDELSAACDKSREDGDPDEDDAEEPADVPI